MTDGGSDVSCSCLDYFKGRWCEEYWGSDTIIQAGEHTHTHTHTHTHMHTQPHQDRSRDSDTVKWVSEHVHTDTIRHHGGKWPEHNQFARIKQLKIARSSGMK